jgi:carbamoyl-phosphate synthase large subunit
MHFADHSLQVPLTSSPDFIKIILEYSRENQIDLIIPLTDLDVLKFSENIQIFRDLGVKVLVSPLEAVLICSDKWVTYKILRESGISQPKTFQNLKNLILDLGKKLVDFPILMKPTLGFGSKGIIEITNMEELEFMHRFYSTKMHNINLDGSNKYIYQEKIKGEEFALTILNDNSAIYLDSFSVKKVSMRSGETEAGYVVIDQYLENLAKKLSHTFKHHFLAEVDLIKSEDRFYPIDINLRFAGSYPFLHSSGINLPEQILRILNGLAYENQSSRLSENKTFVKDMQLIELI